MASRNGGALLDKGGFKKGYSFEWTGAIDKRRLGGGLGVSLVYDNEEKLAGAALGRMDRGKFYGSVTMISLENGTGFVGIMDGWLPHGYGFMRYHNGFRYDGLWSHGIKSGKGSYQDMYGTILFEGIFVAGSPADGTVLPRTASSKPRMRALVELANSSIAWYGSLDTRNEPVGYGVALAQGSSSIDAIIQCRADATASGTTAIVIYPRDKQAYFGTLRDWSRHGLGTMYYEDGTTYTGNWSYGSREGEGELYGKDGETLYIGSFNHNEPVKAVADNNESGSKLGEWRPEAIEPASTKFTQAQIKAAFNIALILGGQAVIDGWLKDEHGKLNIITGGASQLSKLCLRAPLIDEQLRILAPNINDNAIWMMRTAICAVADGNIKNLDEALLKSAFIAAGKHCGVEEGHAAKLAVWLYNVTTLYGPR